MDDATRDVNVREVVNGIEMVENPSPAYQHMVFRNRSVKLQKTDDSTKKKYRQVPHQDDTEMFENVFGIDGLN